MGVRAQITPDQSLDFAEQSVVTTVDMPNTPTVEITGGAVRGTSVFHSFSQFNVDGGQSAFFVRQAAIRNIFARVTGGFPSVINGTLGVIEAAANGSPRPANLFILSPQGIQFGPSARLDLNGSFLATTADQVIFSNGFEFRATQPNPVPMLAINLPVGLQFGAQPGSITGPATTIDTGLELAVPTDQTLALVGGELSFIGTDMSLTLLNAPGGRVELGGVGDFSRVGLDFVDAQGLNSLQLDYRDVADFRDIFLSEVSVDVSQSVPGLPGNGGDIQVQGRRVTLTEESNLTTLQASEGMAGLIRVHASDLLEVTGMSEIFTLAFAMPPMTPVSGSISISAQNVLIRDGGQIEAMALVSGEAGSISIEATESVVVRGNGSLDERALPGITVQNGATVNPGQGGMITIQTPQLILEDGAEVLASTASIIGGGNITIQDTSLVLLRNNSLISAAVEEEATMVDGVSADDIEVGSINIDADLVVALPGENSDIVATAMTGMGGNITISTLGLFGLSPGISEPDNGTNDIDASSAFGLDGTVTVTTPEVDPSEGLSNLPVIVVRPQLANRCSAGETVVGSSFIQSGRGGVPPTPAASSDRTSVWDDLRDLRPSTAVIQRPAPLAEPVALVEAQGWHRAASGDLYLTAQALTPPVTANHFGAVACLQSTHPTP